MPPEILEAIALELGLYAASQNRSPADLLNFMSLSTHFYSALAPEHNARLYARLFKSRFDTAAIGRRFGRRALTATVLGQAFVDRLLCLNRLRSLGLSGRLYAAPDAEGIRQMTADLWMAYLITIEHGTPERYWSLSSMN